MYIRTEDFTSIVGTVVDAVRFTNVTRYGLSGQRSPERREVWLRTTPGGEFKYVIQSRTFLARRDHRVMFLLDEQTVLALFNISTNDSVNYMREDPPRVIHVSDLLIALVLGLSMDILWGAPFWVMGSMAWLTMWTARMLKRWYLQRRVDDVLNTLAPDDPNCCVAAQVSGPT